MVTNEQIGHFATVLEREQQEELRRQGSTYPGAEKQRAVTVKDGRKYIRVDIGSSGAYMVERDTGNIYSIKAYGVIHRGQRFGNVTTVDQWNWSGYRAVPKA